MADSMISITVLVCKFILILLAVIAVLLLPLFLLIGFFLCYYLIKGYRFKPRTMSDTYVSRNLFLTLFVDFPRRVALDLLDRDPDEFNYYGFWLFAGEQGCGKTSAMVWFMRMLQRKYPNVKIRSNIDITFQDDKITSATDIVFSDNGKWVTKQLR